MTVSSDDPEFARFLVQCGIDSMSLNPDAVLPTARLLARPAAPEAALAGAGTLAGARRFR